MLGQGQSDLLGRKHFSEQALRSKGSNGDSMWIESAEKVEHGGVAGDNAAFDRIH